MKRKTLIILTLCIALLAVGLTTLIYSVNRYEVVEVKTVNMSLTVYKGIGFSVDTDALDFGKVEPGQGSIRRSILLNHKSNYSLFVRINKYGQIKEWVTISDNNFFLEPNATKEVFFSVSAPNGTEYGNYTGRLKVVFLK